MSKTETTDHVDLIGDGLHDAAGTAKLTGVGGKQRRFSVHFVPDQARR